MDCTRRIFLSTASGLVLAARPLAAQASNPAIQGANNRIRIGIVGTGGRARGLMNQLKRLSGAEIVAVCDVYEPRLLQAAEIAGAGAVKHTDYRRLLDDRQIDAVLIGAPDHWHKQMTIDAVAAGKDVYVEKPISHSIAEGVEMVKAVEASKQIVQTGTQQRSWDHFILGRQLIDSGRLGQITFVQTYWYQHSRAGTYAPVTMDKLDWKAWLGSAADRPFEPARFYQWRHFWDYGGGCITDLMTHWIDVVHWYMDVDAPSSAVATGRNYNIKLWEAPDTVNATLEFPKNFMAAYLGTYVSRVDDGGLEFRGELGTLKIDRARLAFYRDDAAYAPGTHAPEPEIYIRSSGDGSIAHLQNWLDCIRSRKTPNAPIRAGHAAARTSHITNAAMRSGKPARWNAATGQITDLR
ncbi:MAG TPA: Gfo/Idh/MocA family oxidoreductase [Vicinamibacterales bacterium]|nr:Gfo/Idh/MocA family oxidoreductase [Vicinamibacterales bacterium]